jgi:hypothetical protein
MKTARERATEFVRHHYQGMDSQLFGTMVSTLEASFKEHAQDQRQMCVEAIVLDGEWDDDGNVMRGAVMDARIRE